MLTPALGLLRRLRDRGARIEASDGSLLVTAAPGVLDEELKSEIVRHKPEMLRLLTNAVELLNHRGARLIPQNGRTAVAVWGDADDDALRTALEVVGLDGAEVLHIDDVEADIPRRFRQVVPDYLSEIWAERGLPATAEQMLFAAAKARALNRFFDAYGTCPRPSRITAATVLHGMLAELMQRR